MTTKTKRKRYRFTSREAAESAYGQQETRSRNLLWMITANEQSRLHRIIRTGEYTASVFMSPAGHYDIWCLAFNHKDQVPHLEFFECRSAMMAHINDCLGGMNSSSSDWHTFNELQYSVSRFEIQ